MRCIPGKFDEKEVDKLAYENARYMISVFCPTAMVYSLPFRNIFYVLDWTEQMKKNLEKLSGGFNKRLHDELESLEEQLLLVVGGKQNFHDNKNEAFRFMRYRLTGRTITTTVNILVMSIRQNSLLPLHR